jgi:hypothetical protein
VVLLGKKAVHAVANSKADNTARIIADAILIFWLITVWQSLSFGYFTIG